MSFPSDTKVHASPGKLRRGWLLMLPAVPVLAIVVGYLMAPMSLRKRSRSAAEAVVQADVLRREGRPQQAIAQLRQALALMPGHTLALTGLLDLLFTQGRNDEANRTIWEAFPQVDSPDNRVRLLVFLWAVDSDTRTPEMLERSLGELQRAVEVEPVFENRLALGLNYVMQGNPDDLAKARPLLEESLRQHPENLDARRWLFVCLMRSEEVDLAAQLLEGLPPSVDDHPEVLLMRAQIAMILDRPQDAVGPYQGRLQHRPLDSESHHQLSGILRQLGRLEESELHEKAHAKVTEYFKEAETVLEDLYVDKATPAWAGHCQRMGFITEEMGYLREAEAWYEAALERRADPETRRALQRVRQRKR